MVTFQVGDRIRHIKSAKDYTVLATPEVTRIEAGNKPAYRYRAFWYNAVDGYFEWIRPADEMEDGRFELICHTAGG